MRSHACTGLFFLMDRLPIVGVVSDDISYIQEFSVSFFFCLAFIIYIYILLLLFLYMRVVSVSFRKILNIQLLPFEAVITLAEPAILIADANIAKVSFLLVHVCREAV